MRCQTDEEGGGREVVAGVGWNFEVVGASLGLLKPLRRVSFKNWSERAVVLNVSSDAKLMEGSRSGVPRSGNEGGRGISSVWMARY